MRSRPSPRVTVKRSSGRKPNHSFATSITTGSISTTSTVTSGTKSRRNWGRPPPPSPTRSTDTGTVKTEGVKKSHFSCSQFSRSSFLFYHINMSVQNKGSLTFVVWVAHPEHGQAGHHDLLVSAAEEATVHWQRGWGCCWSSCWLGLLLVFLLLPGCCCDIKVNYYNDITLYIVYKITCLLLVSLVPLFIILSVSLSFIFYPTFSLKSHCVNILSNCQ